MSISSIPNLSILSSVASQGIRRLPSAVSPPSMRLWNWSVAVQAPVSCQLCCFTVRLHMPKHLHFDHDIDETAAHGHTAAVYIFQLLSPLQLLPSTPTTPHPLPLFTPLPFLSRLTTIPAYFPDTSTCLPPWTATHRGQTAA